MFPNAELDQWLSTFSNPWRSTPNSQHSWYPLKKSGHFHEIDKEKKVFNAFCE